MPSRPSGTVPHAECVLDYRIPDDAWAAADARVERSRVIRRSGRHFPILIEESVLRRQIGSMEAALRQAGKCRGHFRVSG
ncbi:Scr1 family TA system antitoxin-like transcriptional regulator [Streptomyces microflavus]|uniref:Scr1 family TA system antitoxin-like transcriptional regulator n=1 Tax=Streptomyces microflavus TaxID=1919 RepID=UPI00365A74F9